MSSSNPASRLDRAIEQAKELRIGELEAEARAEELVRWGRAASAPTRLRWLWPSVAVVACATALALIVAGLARSTETEETVASIDAAAAIQVGTRVAIVASPGADYRIVGADEDSTRIAIARGAVSARLFPGDRPHRLTLASLNLEARATGTIYTVGVDGGVRYAVVHEGHVEVRDGAGERTLVAGQTWPADTKAPPSLERAAARLATTTIEADPMASEPVIAPLADRADAGIRQADETPTTDQPVVVPVTADAGAPPKPSELKPSELWHRARALRGEAKFGASLRVLEALSKRGDPVWSPLALVEAIRIHDRLGTPRRVHRQAAVFLSRYPDHSLRGEVVELACKGDARPDFCPPTP